jgi:hypothetical protein
MSCHRHVTRALRARQTDSKQTHTHRMKDGHTITHRGKKTQTKTFAEAKGWIRECLGLERNVKVPSILNKVQTFSLQQRFLYMFGVSHIIHTNILLNNFFILYNVVAFRHA